MILSASLAFVSLTSVVIFLYLVFSLTERKNATETISRKTAVKLALVVLVISGSTLILGANLEKRTAQNKIESAKAVTVPIVAEK